MINRGDYGKEIYEKEEFQKIVKEKYNLLREDNWVNVDASDSIENVHKNIVKVVDRSKVSGADSIQKLWMN